MKQTVVSRLVAPAVVASGLLAFSPLSNAAVFDFVDWVANNGEQGFENGTPFSMINDGLTLTAKAKEGNKKRSHVYLDSALTSGAPGGMGVCTTLNSSFQCSPSSDDNVSWDGDGREVLAWRFNDSIQHIDLEMGSYDHSPFAGKTFQYKVGKSKSATWMDAMTDGSAIVHLDLAGSNFIRFRAATEKEASSFYIQNADVTVVPVPAAAWLFGSGLVGLVAVARRKRLV